MAWVLIVFAFASPKSLSHNDSIALTSTPFGSQASCEAAGKAVAQMSQFTSKEIKFVCAKTW